MHYLSHKNENSNDRMKAQLDERVLYIENTIPESYAELQVVFLEKNSTIRKSFAKYMRNILTINEIKNNSFH